MVKMKTMDGNTAAAYISYAFTDVAAIYPITPSSPMAEVVDEWAAQGKKNIFGQTVKLMEMQSEAGASGAVHGSLQAGALTTTYTASQGLLLMIPNMYKMAGELLPAVFHVSARALATSSLSIFGDHQDVMATRQTGFALLAEGSVQEVMDLAGVAHLSAIKGRVPFLNFFDGFRTSHEIQKIEVMDYANLEKLLDKDAVDAFRKRGLNPDNPVIRGTAQNPDIYFQTREAVNTYYNALPEIVEDYMGEISKLTGREYHLFNYYGAEDAENIIIIMGSASETVRTVVEKLNAEGKKVGVLVVHLYRPFSIEHFMGAIPQSVKRIAVLDRTKEPGAFGEPLYLDVRAAFYASDRKPMIIGGRYGLGSKDLLPGDIVAVFDNLASAEPKNNFTISITDDVTNTSLPCVAGIDVTPAGTKGCKFWGLGSDGTVGANKSAIKIIGDHTDMYAQGYFSYDSKKSGGVTVSHLRFGHTPIMAPYLIDAADFVAVHNQSYVHKYDVTAGLKKGGTFLLNCTWTPEELDHHLSAEVKRTIANNNIHFYTIDAIKIGKEIGLGNKTNAILQSAFFKLANIIPEERAIELMKAAAKATYGRKGEDVVMKNWAAIDAGAKGVHKVEVPASWANCEDEGLDYKVVTEGRKEVVDFVNNIQTKVSAQEGNTLPVSAFKDYVDGSTPSGSSAYEKRGIAVKVPVWNVDNCIQCNFCSYVCPHAVIRPVALTAEEAANAPEGIKTLPMTGMKDEYQFTMTVSALDCTGCGSCANVCPGKKGAKALAMENMEANAGLQKFFDYGRELPIKEDVIAKFKETTVKGSQFKQPLLEFSGACAGCGETPYAKLITQLFGDRMYIANATGCSSIWGNSSPSTPYTVNAKGQGPAWSNSLFEDNAEFGYGMKLAQNYNEAHMIQVMEEAKDACEPELKEIIEKYLSVKGQRSEEKAIVPELLKLVEASSNEAIKEVLDNKGNLVSKSQWIVGGDGWAYDIGYGGLDHVIANNENVNILVLDTEVYSNTGGQSSKSSQAGSIAKFTAGGKTGAKKDLAQIAMAYGHVYVAQVAMGANPAQTIKALKEAESYDGPSLIIAYAPCQAHGIKGGLANHQAEQKRAIDCGYFNLLRYDPRLEEEGKNPLQLDSKTPNFEGFKDYLLGENRFSQLLKVNPEHAEQLMAKCQADAQKRRARLEKMAQ